jgi:hypothetical protein
MGQRLMAPGAGGGRELMPCWLAADVAIGVRRVAGQALLFPGGRVRHLGGRPLRLGRAHDGGEHDGGEHDWCELHGQSSERGGRRRQRSAATGAHPSAKRPAGLLPGLTYAQSVGQHADTRLEGPVIGLV